jgi:hypothetical protein
MKLINGAPIASFSAFSNKLDVERESFELVSVVALADCSTDRQLVAPENFGPNESSGQSGRNTVRVSCL